MVTKNLHITLHPEIMCTLHLKQADSPLSKNQVLIS